MRRGSWVRELMRRAMIPALLVSFGACASPQSQDDPGARADSPELAPRVWVEQLAGPFRFEGGVLRSESGEPFRIAIASGSLEAKVQESWPGGLFWSSGSSHAAGGLSGQHMRAVEGELSAAQILEELKQGHPSIAESLQDRSVTWLLHLEARVAAEGSLEHSYRARIVLEFPPAPEVQIAAIVADFCEQHLAHFERRSGDREALLGLSTSDGRGSLGYSLVYLGHVEEETGRAANAALKAAKRSAGLISVNDENQVQAAEGLWVSGPVLFDAHALVILRRVGRFGWTNYWILMTAEAGVWSRVDGAPFATAHAQPKAGLVGALFGS